MRARWIQHDRSMELPEGTKTVVAMWWPGVYYLVSTIGTEAEPQRRYLTEVFRCHRDGFPKSLDDRYFLREHEDLERAKVGHAAAVQALAAGELKLNRIDGAPDHLQDTVHCLVDCHRVSHDNQGR